MCRSLLSRFPFRKEMNVEHINYALTHFEHYSLWPQHHSPCQYLCQQKIINVFCYLGTVKNLAKVYLRVSSNLPLLYQLYTGLFFFLSHLGS